MPSEQEIRLHLNDLHMCIADALEFIDEHAYTDADATLDHMQADIACLRHDVSDLFDAERRSKSKRDAIEVARQSSSPMLCGST